VFIRRRNIIVVIEPGEEEVECDHINADINAEEFTTKKDKHKECIAKFCNMGDNEIKDATTFTLKDASNEIVWNILPDGEAMHSDEINVNGETWKKIAEVDENANLNEIYFDHFFPCIKGHTKLIDEYHSSINSPYYSTVQHDNIKFYDPEADDPDYLVKIAYTIMIAAVSEVEQGADNLWK